MTDQTRCRYCEAVIVDERAAVDHMFTWHPVEQRVPRWLKWTRENEKRGKDLTGRAA